MLHAAAKNFLRDEVYSRVDRVSVIFVSNLVLNSAPGERSPAASCNARRRGHLTVFPNDECNFAQTCERAQLSFAIKSRLNKASTDVTSKCPLRLDDDDEWRQVAISGSSIYIYIYIEDDLRRDKLVRAEDIRLRSRGSVSRLARNEARPILAPFRLSELFPGRMPTVTMATILNVYSVHSHPRRVVAASLWIHRCH